MLPFKNLALESFGLEATQEQSKVIVRLTGAGDMSAVEPLTQCLDRLAKELGRLGIRQLEVDIQSLHLLNSSCLKAFVTLIHSIRTAGPELSIKFLVDRSLTWQARTLAPLKRMAPEIVSVSLYPKAVPSQP